MDLKQQMLASQRGEMHGSSLSVLQLPSNWQRVWGSDGSIGLSCPYTCECREPTKYQHCHGMHIPAPLLVAGAAETDDHSLLYLMSLLHNLNADILTAVHACVQTFACLCTRRTGNA